MKQVIEHVGLTDAGMDYYLIDGSRKGRHLTADSGKYIVGTMREGAADLTSAKGIPLRIVQIGRTTAIGFSLWVEHVPIPLRKGVK